MITYVNSPSANRSDRPEGPDHDDAGESWSSDHGTQHQQGQTALHCAGEKHDYPRLSKGTSISLLLQHPVLDPVDAANTPWYAVASYNSKTDDYDLSDEEKDALGLISGCHFEHFDSYAKAKKTFVTLSARQRKGSTVLLLDCKKMKTVKYRGKPIDVLHVEQVRTCDISKQR